MSWSKPITLKQKLNKDPEQNITERKRGKRREGQTDRGGEERRGKTNNDQKNQYFI